MAVYLFVIDVVGVVSSSGLGSGVCWMCDDSSEGESMHGPP